MGERQISARGRCIEIGDDVLLLPFDREMAEKNGVIGLDVMTEKLKYVGKIVRVAHKVEEKDTGQKWIDFIVTHEDCSTFAWPLEAVLLDNTAQDWVQAPWARGAKRS